MDVSYFSLGLIPIFIMTAKGSLSPEGCEKGWVHFDDYCYSFTLGPVHFDAAKDICSVVKKSTLVSLWKSDEYAFVAESLKQIIGNEESAWIGIIPTKNLKNWKWVDASLFDIPKKELPDPDPNVCGSITTKGELKFVDCDSTKPAFVCKKPLDILYLPSSFNGTENLVELDQETIVFERQWPPVLNTVLLDKLTANRLAALDVTQETDCAYRCYTVDECRGFLLKCIASRKCNTYSCSLLSGTIHDEL